MKRKPRLTQKQKKAEFGTPLKNTKDLAPEFSKTVDENFWDDVWQEN